MRIVLVGPAYPLRGGIAHSSALLAQYLGRRHQVDLITFKRQYPSLLFPGKSQEEVDSQENSGRAARLIDSINPLNWMSVARHISRMKPDLLLFRYWIPFFGPCFGTIARMVKKRTGARVLFVCDNIIPHDPRPGDVLFTRYAFRQADGFIVLSGAVERDLKKHFPGSHYRMVPHPVYEMFGDPMDKPAARSLLGISQRKVILFFGYVRAYKGLHVLLESMKLLKDKGFDLLLLSVGEFYEDETKYRSLVEKLGIERMVRIVGRYVPNEEVVPYFSACDAVVLPYLSATQSGIAQIAYNFDKPVISTDTGGLPEVVQDGVTGFIVPPGSPDALARAIEKFYSSGKEPEFVDNVRREKKKYSWENLVDNIENLAAEL